MQNVALNPGGLISWIIVGLVAGYIASRLVRGRGMGCLLDIGVGVVGAFIGGFVVSLFVSPGTTFGFFGSLVIAILGAVILLAIVRIVSPSRPRHP
jgi:uncharacterized membrane protein YeaQ/YmgE (transglycosylase-associated protein family)